MSVCWLVSYYLIKDKISRTLTDSYVQRQGKKDQISIHAHDRTSQCIKRNMYFYNNYPYRIVNNLIVSVRIDTYRIV